MGVIFTIHFSESVSISESAQPSKRTSVNGGDTVSVSDSFGQSRRFQVAVTENNGLTTSSNRGAGTDYLTGLMNRIAQLGGIPGWKP